MSIGRGQFFDNYESEPRRFNFLPPDVDPEQAYELGSRLCAEAADRYRRSWRLIMQHETIYPEAPEGTVRATNTSLDPFGSGLLLAFGFREEGLHPVLVEGAVDASGRPIKNYVTVRYPADEIERAHRYRPAQDDPTLAFLDQVLEGEIWHPHLDPANYVYVQPESLKPPFYDDPKRFVSSGFMTSIALQRLRRENTPEGSTRLIDAIKDDLAREDLQVYGHLYGGNDSPRPYSAEALLGFGALMARFCLQSSGGEHPEG